MSQLVLTATFIRLGRTPFSVKPKQVSVLGQLLIGGRGLWLFHELASGATLRITSVGTHAATMMAGFALAETELNNGDDEVGQLAARLRARAAEGELDLTARETRMLADSVAELGVGLDLSGVGGAGIDVDPEELGSWTLFSEPRH